MTDPVYGPPICGRCGAPARLCGNQCGPEQPPPSRIPPEALAAVAEALAAVEHVLAHRAAAVAEVPGQERWRQTTVDHQVAKMLSHGAEAALGGTVDRDTGLHPLAHAVARGLLGLALAIRDGK